MAKMARWQAALREAALESARREAARPTTWVIRATDPPTFTRVWAVRYTRAMRDAGERVAEDLDLMATCYQRHVVADFVRCEDGIHVMCEFLPPIEALAVSADRMSGVVAALRRSGYHATCSDDGGGTYEF